MEEASIMEVDNTWKFKLIGNCWILSHQTRTNYTSIGVSVGKGAQNLIELTTSNRLPQSSNKDV